MHDSGSSPSSSFIPLPLEDRDSAYQLFVQEAVELFQEIEADLRQAAQNPSSADQRQSIVQAIQIIESGAAQLGLTTLQYSMHRVELLCSLSQPRLRTTELEKLCQVSQTLKLSLLAHVQQTSGSKEIDCTAAQVILVQLEEQLQKQQRQAPVLKSSSSMPVPPSEDKLTALAITAEVEERLMQLESQLASPPSETLATELLQLFESLRDLGEMSNLSELVAISQTAVASLRASPRTAAIIGRIALAGYRETQPQAAGNNSQWAESSSIEPDEALDEDVARVISLDISDAFVWQTGGTVFLLPSSQVLEILISNHDQIDESITPAKVNWQGRTLPVYPLTQFFSGPNSSLLLTLSPGSHRQPSTLLIVQHLDQIFALKIEIERLITASTLELQSRRGSAEPEYNCGSTFLEDSQLYTVVDIALLIDQNRDAV
ncbi:MAG: chemotaxis protein CheW [Cyanobacteria bacterium P01_A01_bin.17]